MVIISQTIIYKSSCSNCGVKSLSFSASCQISGQVSAGYISYKEALKYLLVNIQCISFAPLVGQTTVDIWVFELYIYIVDVAGYIVFRNIQFIMCNCHKKR